VKENGKLKIKEKQDENDVFSKLDETY